MLTNLLKLLIVTAHQLCHVAARWLLTLVTHAAPPVVFVVLSGFRLINGLEAAKGAMVATTLATPIRTTDFVLELGPGLVRMLHFVHNLLLSGVERPLLVSARLAVFSRELGHHSGLLLSNTTTTCLTWSGSGILVAERLALHRTHQ